LADQQGALWLIPAHGPPAAGFTCISAEPLKRYSTVRPFLGRLVEVIDFASVDAGRHILEATRALPQLLGRKKVSPEEIESKLVTGSWRRLVYQHPSGEQGVVDHRAYAFCVLEHVHRALRRRDLFAQGSDRWGTREPAYSAARLGNRPSPRC
jgi:hypothetical protein